MTVGGTGDCLAGVIGALMAQGHSDLNLHFWGLILMV